MGHIKREGELVRCHLKWLIGDQIYSLLVEAGHNFRLIRRKRRLFFFFWYGSKRLRDLKRVGKWPVTNPPVKKETRGLLRLCHIDSSSSPIVLLWAPPAKRFAPIWLCLASVLCLFFDRRVSKCDRSKSVG